MRTLAAAEEMPVGVSHRVECLRVVPALVPTRASDIRYPWKGRARYLDLLITGAVHHCVPVFVFPKPWPLAHEMNAGELRAADRVWGGLLRWSARPRPHQHSLLLLRTSGGLSPRMTADE